MCKEEFSCPPGPLSPSPDHWKPLPHLHHCAPVGVLNLRGALQSPADLVAAFVKRGFSVILDGRRQVTREQT